MADTNTTETKVMIRTSERSSYKHCRQAWWWAYVEHLRPIRVKSPLFFGSMAHEALEHWYIPGKERGVHPAETFERLWNEWLDSGGEEVMVEDWPAGELGVRMMNNYVDHFGEDKNWEVIQPEMLFQVDVMHPVSGRYLFTYVGTIDAVIRDLTTGKVGLLEHKTGAGLDPFGSPITLDDQNGAYWTFAPFDLRERGLLGPDEWPAFMIYNRLRKAWGDERPKNAEGYALNKDGSVSKRQPTPLFRREPLDRRHGDRVGIFARAINEVREMQLVREGKLDVYKNPDKHCTWCEFRDMCEVHETGGDWEAMRDGLYTKWNPYDEHEIFISERN